jgi:catechol 2,3-dioxygenase-like lactoylglutathione lyase family enzyme
MALKTFEHVLILADDVDKTKDFYVDIPWFRGWVQARFSI